MKVKDLIKYLELANPNDIVVLSSDSEGNSYSVLGGWSDEYNFKDGEIGLRKLTKEMEDQGYSEEDVMKGKPAIVLWP